MVIVHNVRINDGVEIRMYKYFNIYYASALTKKCRFICTTVGVAHPHVYAVYNMYQYIDIVLSVYTPYILPVYIVYT